MGKLEIRLDDGRRTMSMKLSDSIEITLDAVAVDALIRALGGKRSLMLPKVPREYNVADPVAVDNPRWGLGTWQIVNGALLSLRDPRYGWISYVFDHDCLQEIIAALSSIDQSVTRKSDERTEKPVAPKGARRRSH